MKLKLKRLGPALALGGLCAVFGAALGAFIGGPEVGYPGSVIGAFGGALGGLVIATWLRRPALYGAAPGEQSNRDQDP
jgi:uncharacterized membrane protein